MMEYGMPGYESSDTPVKFKVAFPQYGGVEVINNTTPFLNRLLSTCLSKMPNVLYQAAMYRAIPPDRGFARAIPTTIGSSYNYPFVFSIVSFETGVEFTLRDFTLMVSKGLEFDHRAWDIVAKLPVVKL